MAAWRDRFFNPAAPGAIGGTTPAAGSFTTLAASGNAQIDGQATLAGNTMFGTSWFRVPQRTTGVANSATTIATLPTSAYTGLMTVRGESGAAGFIDLVAVIAFTPTVISSTTIYGSPGARTYTNSSTAQKVAVASGTWTINTMLDVAS